MSESFAAEDTTTREIIADEEGIAHIAIIMRGTIVHYYAQVEYNITELLGRCSLREDYRRIVPKIPYKLKGRLDLARKVFRAKGPLKIYQTRMLPLIDEFLTFEQTRHLMVHGIMFFEYNQVEPERTSITFQVFDVSGAPRIDQLVCSPRALEAKALEIGRYGTKFIEAVAEIIESVPLAPMTIYFSSSQ